MSDGTITRRSLGGPRKPADWSRADRLTDADIAAAVAADPDAAPLLDEEFFRNAQLAEPAGKVPVTIRLDRDVVEFFKEQGGRYQTRMNAVLRAFMEHEKGRRRA